MAIWHVFARTDVRNAGNIWANWARILLRAGDQSGTKPTTDAGKPSASQAQQPQRPRFTESLESRQMLTAAGPINFNPAHFYPVITGSVQVGNFVNGGLPDLVGADGTNSALHVLINTGDGLFRAGQSFDVPQAGDRGG